MAFAELECHGRDAAEGIMQVQRDVLEQMGQPYTEHLLNSIQLKAILKIFSIIKIDGADLSPILEELKNLPKVLDYELEEIPQT